jgi:predicted CXXCH cytochrome family protein
MARSIAAVAAAGEPPHGRDDHPPSKRRYEIVRKDATLWHREFFLTGAEATVLLSEYPVKYVVGSGRYARTYLVDADGFLVESPVTWYAARAAWDMSPGYNSPKQQGFDRAIGEGCLFCHAGQAVAVGRSTHRMRIIEPAIGCERCHGPGSLHVQRHARVPEPRDDATEIDYTIVNPAHLSRDLAEAVCQQCHLESDSAVAQRGRKATDFRPGLRLQDFYQVYVYAEAAESMTVVGHVEQMHLSRCYQRSSTFSCLTCHDPHGEPEPSDRVAHYRAVCLNCHRPDQCTVEPAHRAKECPDNNCVQCHMPRSRTEVPHVAFTHHRVGIHTQPAKGGNQAPVPAAGIELRPFLQPPVQTEVDQKRSVGEAYRLLSLRDPVAAKRPQLRARALELLSDVYAAGLRDADLDAALAQLCFEKKVGEPFAYAESALAYPQLTGQSRCDALFVVARVQAERGNHVEAVKALRELTGLRRHAFDWLYLANSLRALGDDTAARAALEAAARIDPRKTDVHRFLAEYYRRQGDAERAAWHEQRLLP